MRKAALFAFVCLLLAFIPSLAEAHGHHHWHHHHYHYSHHHHHHHRHAWRHWHHSHHRHYAHRPHLGHMYVLTDHRWLAVVPPNNSSVLTVAERFIGDRNPTRFRGPWCKAFVNMVARKTGHYWNRSLRAIDALHMGIRVRVPRPGDLAVMWHHVTIYAGRGGRGFIAVGGNQGHHRVTVSSYPFGRVVAWVRLQ